jgi:NADP-reducing hydrogenase subunit HndB
MPQIKSLDELRRLREQVEKDISTRKDTGTTIIVGMGTCGIASGARDTMHAVLEELRKRNIEANVTTVGCIGMCAKEPLVDIEQAGKPRVTYGNVTPDMVSRIIEEHLLKGNVVEEWAVGRLQNS